MGKTMENVVKYVKNGECIASSVSSDYLITAGVSNWGGHALAVALYVLSTCPIHQRYVARGLAQPNKKVKGKDDFLNSVEQVQFVRFVTVLVIGFVTVLVDICTPQIGEQPPNFSNYRDARVRNILSCNP